MANIIVHQDGVPVGSGTPLPVTIPSLPVTLMGTPISVGSATTGATVVPASAGKHIYVVGGMVVASGTTLACFESVGSASTANVTGTLDLAANQALEFTPVVPPMWHFKTRAAGDSLRLWAGAASLTGYLVFYQQ